MPPSFPMNNEPVVAIDLDDTLADFSEGWQGWKVIGDPRPFAQAFVRLFKIHGWTTFIFTARPEEGLLWEWLEKWDFTFKGKPSIDFINKSPLNLKLHCGAAKPLADLYIDNASWPWCGDPVPLKKVAYDLLKRGIFDKHKPNHILHRDSDVEDG